ncbi:hypothetical protein HY029_05675 [Candidatus Gottesmanbacteria bacterium]|nr:hypothetical protein [Candidatus Gottesmanbacteria bacterium]
MTLLPLKYIFTTFIIFLFIFVFISKNNIAHAAGKTTIDAEPWTIWSDAFKNCGEGGVAMIEAETEDLARYGVYKPRVSNCRSVDANLSAGMFMLADGFLPLNRKLAALDNKSRALPFLSNAMAMIISTPPASGIVYVADVLQNAGIIAKPAYAQGIGFAGLAPLLPIWKAARNLSYGILILVMLAIGFMIIFRMKIDPKTVISVQAALPRIVMTLIIITFSYAIAGFLIDLMYLVIFLVIDLVTLALKSLPPNTVPDYMTNTNDLMLQFTQSGWSGVWNLLGFLFNIELAARAFQQFFLGSAANLVIGSGASLGLGGILMHLFGSTAMIPILGTALGPGLTFVGGAALIPLVIILIIALGLFYTFVRLFFLLLNSYIQLIISILIGPILLLKEAIPGQSALKDWIKGLVANLVVFPATVLVIMFAWIMTAITWQSNIWGAPLTPTGGGGEVCLPGQTCRGNPIAIFIGLGIIFLAPNLVASIKKLFGAKPAVPVTAGTAFSPVTGVISTGMGAMQSFYYFQQPFVKGAFAGIAKSMGLGQPKGGGAEKKQNA